VALVIGNARYPELPLNNPVNDARLIAGTLQRLGFEVTLGLDLRRADFLQALLQFARQTPADADLVFFYAGHAVQVRGANYLLPVDIRNLNDPDWIEQNAVNLDGGVIRQLIQRDGAAAGTAGLRLLFIDACRDSPFATGAQRVPALTAGLASVQGSANSDAGVLIATSSQPNKPAEDGPPGGNSLYSRHLAQQMAVPGQTVEALLKKVAVAVDRDSRQTQLPMFASSLTTDFFFNPGAGVAAPAALQVVQPARTAQLTVRADSGLNGGAARRPKKSVLWVYVLRHPAGFERATFEALYERAEAHLGADLLGREKLNLSPGGTYQFPLDLAPTARALGVLVAYQEPDRDGWKALLPLGPTPTDAAGAESLAVRIDAGAQRVSIALVP
jgi:type VI secretion system VasD/TssJ family lipoprotein